MLIDNSKYKSNAYVTTLFLSFFSSQFCYVYTGNIFFQLLNMILAFISVCWVAKYISRSGWIFIFIMVIFATVTTLVSQKLKVGDVIFALTMPFFGFLLGLYRKELKLPAIIFCLAVVIYCGNAIVNGWDLNTQLFLSSSRNYISVLGIFSLYCVIICDVDKKIKFFLTFGVALIILFSNSRSAFISFSLIIFYFIFASFRKHRLFAIFSIVAFVIVVPLYITIYAAEVYDYLYNSLGIVRRLSSGELSDAGRFEVLSCYYNKIDGWSFIIGLDYLSNNTCSYLANGTDNPHNSFIRLFSNLGLFGFVILFMISWAALKLFKTRRFLLLCFLLCFLIRGATDIIFFFQTWDSYLLSLIIIAMPSIFLNESGRVKVMHENFRSSNV